MSQGAARQRSKARYHSGPCLTLKAVPGRAKNRFRAAVDYNVYPHKQYSVVQVVLDHLRIRPRACLASANEPNPAVELMHNKAPEPSLLSPFALDKHLIFY